METCPLSVSASVLRPAKLPEQSRCLIKGRSLSAAGSGLPFSRRQPAFLHVWEEQLYIICWSE